MRQADVELERIVRDSRLGSWFDFVTRATEIAWAESRTRAAARWLAGIQ